MFLNIIISGNQLIFFLRERMTLNKLKIISKKNRILEYFTKFHKYDNEKYKDRKGSFSKFFKFLFLRYFQRNIILCNREKKTIKSCTALYNRH